MTSSPNISAVAVFTGARDGSSPRYLELATDLGRTLAHAGVTVVYGGGRVGLMGAVADGALGAGGRVVGVMPEHLVSGEIAHPGLTQLDVVGSMHERKQRMTDLADAFIALPGGGGTLDEFFEAWTWQQLGVHSKPVGLCGREFWQPLLDMLDHMVAEGFVRAEDRGTLVVADGPEDVLPRLSTWQPPAPKWR
ncbi:TIGR00730 family Rossman fold protein [Kocuria sp.]|uniref:LOG family protein n=1 Tax=Kocuria sp. TaxID=1871328 RepID=UPI0026DD8105|nr:TIGR00730 family Rossman fold protein [Kocuria sp.]MDO4919863.1 TIGR00730 family Rossman fold protein [Kocuria sp.]